MNKFICYTLESWYYKYQNSYNSFSSSESLKEIFIAAYHYQKEKPKSVTVIKRHHHNDPHRHLITDPNNLYATNQNLSEEIFIFLHSVSIFRKEKLILRTANLNRLATWILDGSYDHHLGDCRFHSHMRYNTLLNQPTRNVLVFQPIDYSHNWQQEGF